MLGMHSKAFPDAGNCVRYEVAIQLADGKKLNGFVYLVSYEKRFEFRDITFLDYLNRVSPSDTLIVLQNIRQLNFPIINDGQKCQFHFEATPSENKILKKSIKSIEVLSYRTCNICDLEDLENGYYWKGIYPVVITELTKSEIDLLQTTPIATINFSHGDQNTEGYWIASYSVEYRQDDLTKIKDSFLVEADRILKVNGYNALTSAYKRWKNDLRKKKVIVFKFGYAE